MISLTKIRELDLSAATSRGRHLHLSAASGLVCAGPYLYVVADDELHLGVFRAGDAEPGQLIRLFPGKLPAFKALRKKRKPDLETLLRVPPFAGCPHGALLALGSGGKRNRRRGALLALDAGGTVEGAPRAIDLADMFAALDDEFPALNIEGGIISGGELHLLQRGNKKNGRNALIRFQLSPLLDALTASSDVDRLTPLAVHTVDLGNMAGIPLCFTDCAALPTGDIVFSAIAENTEDNYNDGPCAGAAIGILSPDGILLCLHQLDQAHKIEGIDARMDGEVIRLLLVTDADDAKIPAGLFSAGINRDQLGVIEDAS